MSRSRIAHPGAAEPEAPPSADVEAAQAIERSGKVPRGAHDIHGTPWLPPEERKGPLSNKARSLARFVGQGMSWPEAGRRAGFSENQAFHYYKTDPRVQALIRVEQGRNEVAADMTRKKVMDGFAEAIEMARIQSDPATMIKGWTEVAKMCGYYAAEKKQIEVSISAKRLIDKFETMTDDELLKYAEKEVFDVDFVEKEPSEGQKRLAHTPEEPDFASDEPENGPAD